MKVTSTQALRSTISLAELLLISARGAVSLTDPPTRDSMSKANSESYTGAKEAISALTRSLAVTLAGRVRVNSISPGWIDTTDGIHTVNDEL